MPGPPTPFVPLAGAIDALLPQTQCGRCGYAGCAPYAAAIASGAARINRCPPGGQATIERLAALTGLGPLPLDPDCGPEHPDLVAFIRADDCIGCARCLPPCPVDAIIGAQKMLHTVLAGWCTGCELCLPACPVDCIELVPRPAGTGAAPAPALNLARYQAHVHRAEQRGRARAAEIALQKQALAAGADCNASADHEGSGDEVNGSITGDSR